jgi:hypothetical protein
VQDLLPYCYRCSSTNPLVSSSKGDACVNCGHPFIRSFATFDPLPLVQFMPGEVVEGCGPCRTRTPQLFDIF